MKDKWLKVKIKRETHAAFKQYCILTQVKMQDVANMIITEFLINEATKTALNVIDGVD